MHKPEYIWDMKKPNRPLIWDTYPIINTNSNKCFEIPFIMAHTKFVLGDIYFCKHCIGNIEAAIRYNLAKDANYPDRIAAKLYGVAKSIDKTGSRLAKVNIKAKTNNELIQLFAKLFNQVGGAECFMSWRGTCQMANVLMQTAKDILLAKVGEDKTEEHLLLLSMPDRESFMITMKKDIEKAALLVREGRNKAVIEKRIAELHRNYSWTGCIMFDGGYISLGKFRDMVKETVSSGDFPKEKSPNNNIPKIINRLGFSKKEKKLVKQLREWSFLRTYAKDYISKAVANAMLVLYEIAARKGIDPGLITYLRKEEIDNIFGTKKEKLVFIINERRQGWAAVADGSKVTFFAGDLSAVEEKELDEIKTGEINGQTASRGYVKGVVRYVKDSKELHKVQKGDILVTSMTTTDFTPILHKISGLITDEGGLTSHAAIVSRELGIPCIIGTKNATKILKDGDYVELDANKGIIRKINRRRQNPQALSSFL